MADTPAQVALDEKGLEAATAAYNDLMFGNDSDHAEQIVRAYLSSLSGDAGDDGQGALVDYTNLLSVITDIRMKSGVGAKPMLSELAGAIGDKIASGRMAGDAIHAVRELLDTAGVPSAAFIDDHVRNAIVQRDEARAERDDLRADKERLKRDYEAVRKENSDLAELGPMDWRDRALAAEAAERRLAEQPAAQPGVVKEAVRRELADVEASLDDAISYLVDLAGAKPTPMSPQNCRIHIDHARMSARNLAALAAPVSQEPVHPDDEAVDRFAAAMKTKLAQKRAEGRGGWEGPDCDARFLSRLLREHVEKGDPLDVGNLAMMLHQRGERITAPLTEGEPSEAEVWKPITELPRDRDDTYLIMVENVGGTGISPGFVEKGYMDPADQRGWVDDRLEPIERGPWKVTYFKPWPGFSAALLAAKSKGGQADG